MVGSGRAVSNCQECNVDNKPETKEAADQAARQAVTAPEVDASVKGNGGPDSARCHGRHVRGLSRA